MGNTVSIPLDLTGSGTGILCLGIFITAYVLVIAEDRLNLRKSMPVVIAGGAIWMFIAFAYGDVQVRDAAAIAVRQSLRDYAELLLFLIGAMTYVNTLSERNVFSALSARLIGHGFGYRSAFWITGGLAFCLSPLIDNLTTALVLGAVVSAIGAGSSRFTAVACVNIVVAANAGGAFSPFGDITTLMVWQAGRLEFTDFVELLLPCVVSYLIPAFAMYFAVPKGVPAPRSEIIRPKKGAVVVMLLFLATLSTAIVFHQFLDLPPFLGMMTGLGYLQLFDYFAKRHEKRITVANGPADVPSFDVYREIARAEWGTLLFFYGVIMCVEGLGFIGYLSFLSEIMYGQWGPTTANVTVGLMSSIIDNIPVMVSVLEMSPNMARDQWLLVTLTAGIGGSLFSIGSAAGVALMGQARHVYTFTSHLRWAPVIALGFFAAVALHLWLNGGPN